MTRFEPKIMVFNCNWCSYAGADLAGTSRLQYAPNIRIVRVMCSGRVEPYFILEALQAGADGVLVLGCHPGECHYLEGNYRTIARMVILKKMLAQFGIEEDRVRLDWVSASEGVRFASIVNQVTEAVRALGPFPRDAFSPQAGDIIPGQSQREGVAPRGFAAGGGDASPGNMGDVSPNKGVARG